MLAALAEADEIYASEQAGEEPPPTEPSATSMPSFSDSVVIPVRLSAGIHARLAEIASGHVCEVADVIRSAVFQWLRKRE